jgi:beta-lactam-binding protein with PASTA domain
MAKAVHHERSGTFPMPDLTGQTEAQARDTLARDGVTGDVEVDTNYACHDDHVVTAQVCSTQPAAGQPTSAHLPVTLHLRPEGEQTFAMPDLGGMTADAARTALARLGEDPARITVETLPNDPGGGCKEGRVCRQSPAPGNPGYAHSPVLLDLGPAGAGAHPAPAPTTGTPPTTTAAPAAPKPDQPAPEKKKDDAPAPLF